MSKDNSSITTADSVDLEQSSVDSTIEDDSVSGQDYEELEGAPVDAWSVQPEAADFQEKMLEYFNHLPGGLLKTSTVRFVMFAVTAICADWLYQMSKFESQVAWLKSEDMSVSSTLGAFLMVFSLTASRHLNSQLYAEEAALLNPLFLMICNLLGVGLRTGLATVTQDSIRVGPGEAAAGGFLGGIFVAVASVIAIIAPALMLIEGVANVRRCLSPPSELNATALQALGQSRQMDRFSHQATDTTDIELGISRTSHDEMKLSDILTL